MCADASKEGVKADASSTLTMAVSALLLSLRENTSRNALEARRRPVLTSGRALVADFECLEWPEIELDGGEYE